MKQFMVKAVRRVRAGYLREMYGELRWMYQYIKKYRLWVVFYICIGIAGAALSLGVSVISRSLIDAVIGRSSERLAEMAGLMAGMAVGSILASAAVSRVSAKIMVDVQNEMRGEMYSRILYSCWEELQLYSTGDLLNRLNSDMSIVSRNVIGWLPSLLTKGFQFLAALAVILYYDPTMALLALVSAPATLLLSRVLVRRMREYNKEMREISSDIMSFQNDSFQNLQTLKAFGLMGTFSGKMDNIQEHYRERLMDYNKFNIFVSSYMSAAGTAVSYLCFGWSIYRLWGGYISVGTMAMFLQLASGLSAAFNSLVHMIPALLRAAASAGRIMAVEEMEKESVNDPKAEALADYRGPVEIELRNAAAAYEEGGCVFSHSDFNVSSGEIAAIVGPSGDGKTTLIRLLLGLLNPAEGSAEILWDGGACGLSAATRICFSYVPQGNTIFMGTIAENLRLVKPDAGEDEMRRVLEQACAWEFVSAFPEGLNHYIGEHGAGLSEGQAQRIAIARALLRDAPVLLLDEATSALDMETERKVLEQIVKSDARKLCIITTHRLSVLAMCDRIYEIKEGKICQIQRKADEKL